MGSGSSSVASAVVGDVVGAVVDIVLEGEQRLVKGEGGSEELGSTIASEQEGPSSIAATAATTAAASCTLASSLLPAMDAANVPADA